MSDLMEIRDPGRAAVRPRRTGSALICTCLFALMLQSSARAAGDSFELRGDDLQMAVDTRWAGGASGGYWPIRLRIVNRGPGRFLTLRFVPPSHEKLPIVEKGNIQVDQNATVNVTLSVPMVGQGTGGQLHVESGGRLIPQLSTRYLSFPGADNGQFARPSLLVISPNKVDCDQFEMAVNSLQNRSVSGGHHWAYTARSDDHAVIPPVMLPESWIDYSGLDLVAVSLDTLDQLTRDQRSAILQWTEQGGNLVVYRVSGRDEKLGSLLDLQRRAFIASGWIAPGSSRDNVQVVHQNPMEVPAHDEMVNEGAPQPAIQGIWDLTEGPAFEHRALMLGRVVAFDQDPWPGSQVDWQWMLETLGADQFQWSKRHGFSSRSEFNEFLHFLIPGISGVPIGAFLALMTIFTVVIGPLNYFALVRRKQLYLLVVTIPVIALATSLSLFGYSMIAHGFSTKSRVRSMTYLDQQQRRAITTNRVSLYAGLAPSRGLRYSPDTAVYTLWPQDASFTGGRVNWTDTQNLESGWLRSRTRTQFYTVAHRDERGRLDVRSGGGNGMEITNGLKWDLDMLLVADADGNTFYTSDLPAGASTALRPAGPKERDSLMRSIRESQPSPPEDGGHLGRRGLFGFGRRHSYYYQQQHHTFASNLSERHIQRFAHNTPEPNSYVAVLKSNLSAAVGVESSEQRNSLHLLLGYF